MEIEEHKARHLLLHHELDELIADFISHNDKALQETTILDLMKWSHAQTIEPTELKKS